MAAMKWLAVFVWLPLTALAFVGPTPTRRAATRVRDTIVSPFDESSNGATTATTPAKLEGPLDLTWENVEAVLDEMRPYLIQDGGNVVISDIDDPVVRLELQVGAWSGTLDGCFGTAD